jgi:hypothetical protein
LVIIKAFGPYLEKNVSTVNKNVNNLVINENRLMGMKKLMTITHKRAGGFADSGRVRRTRSSWLPFSMTNSTD